MGLFGNSNKKIEKMISQLEKKGFNSESYKSRKCCENCSFYSPAGRCTYSNQRTIPSEYCHNYFEK